jgi:diguanylate cyclase (GGDEF)-like protein
MDRRSGRIDPHAPMWRHTSALPLALVVFDASGNILDCNDRLLKLLFGHGEHSRSDGWRELAPEVIGANVLDFLHAEDHAYAVDLLSFSVGLPERVMGPVRLRYVTIDGSVRFTDFWVENRLDDPSVRGYVVVLTEEATQHRFAEAVALIAAGADLDEIFETVARSMAGHPMASTGVLIGERPDGSIGPLHETALDPALSGLYPGDGPGLLAGEDAVPLECAIDADVLGSRVAAAADAAGFAGVWRHPVPSPRGTMMLVCWRREPGPASPNQRVHLKQAVDICGLAVTQEIGRRQLETLAYTDPLTGLANRARLAGVAPENLPGSAVLYVDLDHFKAVNDQLGHEVGDMALRHVADVMRNVIRRGDEVVRLGGDEFVVLCQPPCGRKDLALVADRLIAAISEPVELAGRMVALGASIGIVHHRDHPDLERLIQEADAALYLAKAKGRGKWWMAPAA